MHTRTHRSISHRQDAATREGGGEGGEGGGAVGFTSGAMNEERSVLKRIEYLTDVMGDILNHVGGDADRALSNLAGQSANGRGNGNGGGGGGGAGADEQMSGTGASDAPSKADD
jgi:hypothetical protein